MITVKIQMDISYVHYKGKYKPFCWSNWPKLEEFLKSHYRDVYVQIFSCISDPMRRPHLIEKVLMTGAITDIHTSGSVNQEKLWRFLKDHCNCRVTFSHHEQMKPRKQKLNWIKNLQCSDEWEYLSVDPKKCRNL